MCIRDRNIFNQYRDVYYKTSPKKSVDEYAKKYVAYAKKNNLPLPNGMKQDAKSKTLPPKVAPLKSKAKSPKVKPEKKEIQPLQEKITKKIQSKPEKPKNSLYSDIR